MYVALLLFYCICIKEENKREGSAAYIRGHETKA